MQQLAVNFQLSVHKAGFYLYSNVTDNNRVKRNQQWRSCISKQRISLVVGRMGLELEGGKYVQHEIIRSNFGPDVKLFFF